ncbi:MAG: hypothetical protein JO196_02130 [Hyphomicrobiales bacterium]|nr:hypothetical protein [Hyphomicrobiales bacterium]
MGRTDETEKQEARAYEKSRAVGPEHSDSENVFGRAAKAEPEEERFAESEDIGNDPPAETESEILLGEFIAAERALPDVPSETTDGLNELEEETRRQAEDRGPERALRRDR